MRACHVVYSYFPFDPRVRREVETLQRMGHEIDVIAMREPGESRVESVLGARVHRIPFAVVRGGKLRYAFQYLVFLLTATALLFILHSRKRYDIVHIHSLPDFQVFAALPEKLSGARVVLDLHEAMPEIFAARFQLSEGGLWMRLAQGMEWVSCAFADVVIVVNDVIRDVLTGRGIDPDKVVVVMNSPDLHGGRVQQGELPSAPDLGPDPKIVYVGGINPERDLEVLVKAIGKLHRSHRVGLTVVGYGDAAYGHRLRAAAQREALGDRFRLMPRIDQGHVLAYLSESVAGPVTYQRNPLTELAVPNKVFEYAAVGKPLVIADLRALRRLFGDAALYYAPGNAEELAGGIATLLGDEGLREILADRARKVLDRCSWAIMAERLRLTYQGVLTHRGPWRASAAMERAGR
jgi:glycosyltransferase involved in cell wall biosynthesis